MKILIAEDDLASRKITFEFLSHYGECDLTVDGIEALDAFLMAWDEGEPYDLICLDIMMPKVDGLKTLKIIRELESEKGIKNTDRVKIIMTTALSEIATVREAFKTGFEVYAAKPIDTQKMLEAMRKFQLIE